ncbi:hypothetical protein Q668_08765 [Alcanivorax sp. PN-3]|uniref:hypothetical protein n=1 Tax=Alloalcanivorax xenomutans TaxID=1094342 RepID=UPI0003B8EB72|nr:hypothetical protein [Alloalcanivorax xenomutans]ERS14788.1 hypothetical protein Q668_08765 [Alcanivorax sp. PN-3]CUR47103.1 RecA/RadA recombinase [Alloalcanivorax xenomutans]
MAGFNENMDALQQLLRRQDTWQGPGRGAAREEHRHTGFPALDRLLWQGGWPNQGLVELLCPLPCPSLLHLLLPLLRRREDGARIIANPPARPSATALKRAGLPLEQILVLQARERSTLLRACLEAASSDTLDSLVLWAPGGALPTGTLRRLHMAAQQGRCLFLLVRPRRASKQPSPAPLRLLLDVDQPGELSVTVGKQPGGRHGQQCRLVVLPEHLRHPPPPCATMATRTRRPGTATAPSPLALPAPTSEVHP